MKLFLLFFVLVGMFSATAFGDTPIKATDTHYCQMKYPTLRSSISAMCANKKGMTAGPNNAIQKGQVRIFGYCKPPQWIPQTWCYKQFFNMCANSAIERKYGRNGCQTWQAFH